MEAPQAVSESAASPRRPGRWDALAEDFLAEVRRTGNVMRSADRCGVDRSYWYRRGPEFRARVVAARDAYHQARIDRARRRISAARSADGDSCHTCNG